MNIIRTDISNDKTKKYFMKVSDAGHIEACLLYLSPYGYIICVSSQIGCSQKCKFCAASKSCFTRNLSCDEIREQVQIIIDDNPQLLKTGFQITYMGSGEPLCNYKNVFESIDLFRQQYSSLSKVNISTTCPSQSEECFKNIDWEKYKDFLHFQYSLHFTDDNERYKFMWPKLLKITDAIKYLNTISGMTNDIYRINYIPFNELERLFNLAKAEQTPFNTDSGYYSKRQHKLIDKLIFGYGTKERKQYTKSDKFIAAVEKRKELNEKKKAEIELKTLVEKAESGTELTDVEALELINGLEI